jgi:hypothetical protein
MLPQAEQDALVEALIADFLADRISFETLYQRLCAFDLTEVLAILRPDSESTPD